MDINAFGPNLSFFFSNGVDPEYAVIGRVARRIWAKAMRDKYGASPRAQMLKYHIQTSGRSLHAQGESISTTSEQLFKPYMPSTTIAIRYIQMRTTKQSQHPTEESVRRAMAIQLIINKELGLAMNENPMQGSFIIEELTDLVEEAVLMEFDNITERGGVWVMETMYQRSRIQEESLHYETLKHTGEYEIVGVNTFLSSKGSPTIIPGEVIRATDDEKQVQLRNLNNLQKVMKKKADAMIVLLQKAAVNNENIFEKMMEVCKVCSLGQITSALFGVGGQYRRNM